MQLKLPRCKIRRQPEWKNPRLPAPPCNITGIACPTQSCRLPIFFFPPLHFLKHIWNSLFLYPSSSSSSLLLSLSLSSFQSSPFSFLFLVSLFVLVGSPRSRFAIRSERFSGVVFFVSFFSIFSLSSLSLRELSCEFPGFSSSYQYFCATTISSHFPILIISIQNN